MKTKEMKGITLVALVVTIVVLLILAGVSINAVVGDNGIIKKAQQSANLSKEAEAKEVINRAILEFSLSKGYETLKDFLQTKIENGTIDNVEDNSDGTLKIWKNGYFVDNVKNRTNSSKGDVENSGGSTGDVEDKIITLSATPYNGTYDGNSHNVITNISANPSDSKIEYSIDGTNFSTTMPTITNASSISVTIKASKTGYTTKTINVIATVAKAEGKITLSETNGTVDKGNSITFTVNENTGTLSVVSSDTSVATASISKNIVTINSVAKGIATITVTSSESTNYTEKTATYSVTIKSSEFTEESGVGYYADVDNDGTVDGIIFADRKKGASDSWGSSGYGSYSISTVSDIKGYYVSQESYNGPFGAKKVLATKETSGNERFYVMNLKDYNTVYTKTYIFEKAQSITSGRWSVPSRNLLAAFGGELGITTSNYREYGLSDVYWSSTAISIDDFGYSADFSYGKILNTSYDGRTCAVRLARTF